MQYKTSFSGLNYALGGGLFTGGVYLLAGPSNTFKTGLGITMGLDITQLNQDFDFSETKMVYFLRMEETVEQTELVIDRITSGLRESTVPAVLKHIRKGIQNNWAFSFSKTICNKGIQELAEEIDQEEKQSGAKIKVLVLDHFFLLGQFGQRFSLSELTAFCKERDIVAIVPTTLSNDDLSQPGVHKVFKDSVDPVAGIVIIKRQGGDRHEALNLTVWSEQTNKWDILRIPFKKDPEYGLVSDIQSE